MKTNGILSKLTIICLGGIMLCFMAFYNNYPLLYSDTGRYIFSGFLGEIPPDRPLTYGLFLRHMSLAEVSWLVILVQGIIVSALIYLIVKYFLPNKNHFVVHFSLIALLVFCTGVSVTVSFLMPDVFTPVVLMALALLLLAPLSGRADWFFVCLFLWLGLIVHISHLMIMLGVISLFTLISFFKKGFIFNKKRLIVAWAMFAISLLSIPTIHYMAEKEFMLSRSSHPFIMNHLVEIGVVDVFLKDRCPNAHYSLCDFQGKIPTDFIWDMKNSPPYILWKGDDVWENTKVEYDAIIKEIITTPKYFKIIAYKSIIYTAKQFFSFNAGDTSPQHKDTAPYGGISYHFPDEIREQELAFQQRRNHFLRYNGINTRQTFLFFVSLCFYVAIFYMPKLRQNLSHTNKQLLFFLMIGLLMNAFVCGNLSTIIARYQCRVVWLFPLITSICLIQLVPRLLNNTYFKRLFTQI